MIAKTLPILAMMGFWQEITDGGEEWLNKNFPIASRGVGGLPGLIKPEWGMDVSAPATFQFPSGATDLAGPAISDLVRLYNDVIVPSSTYGVEMGDVGKISNIAPILRHYKNVWNYAMSDDNWLRDKNGNKLYQVPSAIPFVMQSLAGVENIDLNRIKAEEGILNRREARANGARTRIINEAMDAITKGKMLPADFVDRAMRAGVTNLGDSLKSRIKSSELPPDLRHALRTEIMRRPEVLEMYPGAQDFVK
jgi:hypothetical protein